MMWGYGYHDGPNDWGYVAMVIGMLIFWGGLVLVVGLVVREFARRPHAPGVHRSAEQLLAERFARGEIDVQEFESRIASLRKHAP